MTEIVKITDAAGVDRWTAAGSPAHHEIQAGLAATQNQTGSQDSSQTGGQGEEEVPGGLAGEETSLAQAAALHHDGDDHDTADTGDRPGDGPPPSR